MKITYRREIKHNYMMIDPETLTWEGYQVRILEHNQIDGLLGLQLRQTAEGILFYYDITSRQPLSRMLQGQKWKAEQIRELMREIFGILERMEHYLLSENDIYLDPDYIYVDPENQKIWLCLIPGLSGDFTESLRKLLENILEHIDHQDRDTVMLAYGLHHQSCKPNFGLDDILRLIYQKTDIPSEASEEDEEEHPSSSGNNRKNTAGDSREHSPERREAAVPAGNPNTEQGESQSILSRILNWFQEKKKSMESRKEEESEQPAWEAVFREPIALEDTGRSQNPPAPEYDSRGTTQEKAFGNSTADPDLYCREDVRILRAMDIGEPDIPIPYYPYIIGTQENIVDHILDHQTISRLHLKLENEGDRYFVQDLNSTNGTTLNGRELQNNERAEIRRGDDLRIAQYWFMFQ